jgi:hypothetical protein
VLTFVAELVIAFAVDYRTLTPMLDDSPSPETVFAIAVLAALVAFRIVRWFQQAIPSPDPWSQEVQDALQRDDTLPLCPQCLAPQPQETWFCAECGQSIGPYNNLNPYLYIFSLGDLFRSGVTGRLRRGPLVVLGFLLLSLSEYIIFAPYYWFLFFRNLKRNRAERGPAAAPSQSA